MYFKFPEIAFFSCIQPPEPAGLQGTKVNEQGQIGQPQTLGADWGDFLLSRVRKSQYTLDEHENEKILEKLKENPDEAIESKTFEVMIQKMRRAWAEHDITEYLSESDCPVCHTNHRVLDSLPDAPLTKSHVESLSGKFEYINATFPDDQLAEDGIPTGVTDTLIVSNDSKTKIIMYYMETGWIVAEELPHGGNPEIAGEQAYEHYKEEFDSMMNDRYGTKGETDE